MKSFLVLAALTALASARAGLDINAKGKAPKFPQPQIPLAKPAGPTPEHGPITSPMSLFHIQATSGSVAGQYLVVSDQIPNNNPAFQYPVKFTKDIKKADQFYVDLFHELLLHNPTGGTTLNWVAGIDDNADDPNDTGVGTVYFQQQGPAQYTLACPHVNQAVGKTQSTYLCSFSPYEIYYGLTDWVAASGGGLQLAVQGETAYTALGLKAVVTGELPGVPYPPGT